MRLDIKENVAFPFNDPGWVGKLVKLSLCQFLGVTAPAVMGYQLAMIREAANGEDERLPEFGPDFGNMWVKGFIFSLMIGFVLLLPGAAIGIAAVASLSAYSDSQMVLLSVFGASGLYGLLMLVYLLFYPALMLRYAMTGEASCLFNLKAAVSDIKQGPKDYALIFLVSAIGSGLSVSLMVTGIGYLLALPLMILTLLVQARMLGNYYRAYFH